MRRLFILLINFLICMTALADREGFYYKSWSVDATINKDNVWNVREVESVFFEEPRHGIYRYIPLDFYARLNAAPEGEPHKDVLKQYYVKIEVSSADEAVVSTDDNENIVIRFGNPDYEVEGDRTYRCDYTYAYPTDRIDTRDFIYHTLKPADVNERVEEFRFNLYFEKPLPDDIANRLVIYRGQWGKNSTIDSIADLVITPSRISGTVTNLNPKEALTIYAELPEGFWENPNSVSPTFAISCAVIAIVLALLLLYFELSYRRPVATKVIEYYAPDDITPSEVGVIIDDTTDTIDLTALVPWLAQKGYISIKEIKNDSLLKKKTDIELTKLKSLPDDAPVYQQKIMEMLFPNDSDTQLMSELGEHPKKVEAAKSALTNHFTGERKLMDLHYGGLAFAVVIFSTLAFAFNSLLDYFDITTLLTAFLLWAISMGCAFAVRILNTAKDDFRSKATMITLFVARLLVFLVVCVILKFIYSEESDNAIPEWLMLIMVVLSYLSAEFSGRLNHDTPYRMTLKGRLLGFQEFISTAEKDRLQMLVDRDPEYFYSVLPYAMIFDLSDKWITLFKDINIKQTDWYQSSGPYDSIHYISSLNQGMSSTVNSAITTSSHDSSSGGSSGGGFSGGGGGGGGGGSW